MSGKTLRMKKTVKISLHRCVCAISACCLVLPPIAGSLRTGAMAGADVWTAGLLSASAVLLLLPVSEEGMALSFRFALGELAACAAGVWADLPPRLYLLPVLGLHALCLTFRAVARYAYLRPLFRQYAVWHGVENHARDSYSLALYLLAAAFPSPAAPAWAAFLVLPPAAALYAVLLLRVRTGRTFFIGKKKELELKGLLKGNLRPVPPQTGPKDEDAAKMGRLYDRVVEVMEQKRPFLDPDFNLMNLASLVFSNKTYLSRTINIQAGRNFSQFVNHYRIQYALELIRQDRSLKVINLAMMCGFHSTVSFNMAFKLNMGETPSAYMERMREGGEVR